MISPYQFRPMTAVDLLLVKGWLAQRHVVEWWGDTDEQLELVRGDLAVDTMDQYIVSTDERPFAYIQCYDLRDWPGHGLGEHPPATRAIDQFIGEYDMVGRGHGSAFIRAFTEGLLAKGMPRIVTDPDPDNLRAVRAYEKAGFIRRHLVDTSEGVALLMARDA